MLPTTRMLRALICVICFFYFISLPLYGQRNSRPGDYTGFYLARDDRNTNHYAYGYSHRSKYIQSSPKNTKPRKHGHCKKNTYYRARPGDTLYKIARKFNLSIHTLCEINKINSHYRVKRGQRLTVSQCKKLNNKFAHIKPKSTKRPVFQWPLRHVRDYQRDGSKGIKPIGIIINTRPNEIVHSSAHGIVKRIGRMRGFGNYVVIKHSDRYTTVYAHLHVISVSEGDQLAKGQRIGKSSDSLHFQIDYAGKPLNPLIFLPKRS